MQPLNYVTEFPFMTSFNLFQIYSHKICGKYLLGIMGSMDIISYYFNLPKHQKKSQNLNQHENPQLSVCLADNQIFHNRLYKTRDALPPIFGRFNHVLMNEFTHPFIKSTSPHMRYKKVSDQSAKNMSHGFSPFSQNVASLSRETKVGDKMAAQ